MILSDEGVGIRRPKLKKEGTNMFWAIVIGGYGLILLQLLLARSDGYFSQRQMRSIGVYNGWSLFQHGGWWADILFLTPLVAWIVDTHSLPYFSWFSPIILIGCAIAIYIMGCVYAKGGVKKPEAHAHPRPTKPNEPWTPPTGWVHGAYALPVFWILVLAIFAPDLTDKEYWYVAAALTPFFFFGVMKFSRKWRFESGAKMQVIAMCFAIFVVGLIRSFFFV